MSSRDTLRSTAPQALDPGDVESGAHVVRVAQVVREALEAYASTDRVDEMLREAMGRSGRSMLPRTARELDAFVAGHLGSVVAARLGEDAADALREHLAPMIAAMERMEAQLASPSPSTPRSSALLLPDEPRAIEPRGIEPPPTPCPAAEPPSSRPASTLPPPPGSPDGERGFAAIVLAGSPQDASRLALRVKMPVQRASDTASFVAAISGFAGAPSMVVVDCRFQNPITTVGPRVLEHRALDGAVVVLWGGNAFAERAWSRHFPGAIVLRTDVASDLEDIAVLIRLGPA